MTLLSRGYGDFYVGRSNKFRDSDRCTRRPWLLEVRRIDGIHSRKQIHVGQINLHGHGVSEFHSRFLQDKADIVQTLLHFRFEVIGKSRLFSNPDPSDRRYTAYRQRGCQG